MEHAPAIDGYLMAAVFAYVLRGRLLPRDLDLQVCNENHVRDQVTHLDQVFAALLDIALDVQDDDLHTRVWEWCQIRQIFKGRNRKAFKVRLAPDIVYVPVVSLINLL